MNTSNSLLEKSFAQLRATLIPNMIFMVLGPMAMIFSSLMIYVIWKSKELRYTFFYLLMLTAFGDFLLGISYFALGAKRIYRYYSGVGETVDMWQCCWEVCGNTLSQLLALAMAAVMVVDRLLSALFPLEYNKKWPKRRVIIPLISVALIYSFIQLGVHFNDSCIGGGTVMPVCSVESTVFPTTLSNLAWTQVATSALVVVANLILALLIRYRMKKTKNAVGQLNARNVVGTAASTTVNFTANQQTDVKVFKTITVIVIVHITAHLGGRLCSLLVSAYMNDDAAAVTQRYTRSLVVLNAAVHFLLLIATSSKFRMAAGKVLRSKNAQSIVAVNTSQQQPVSSQPMNRLLIAAKGKS